MAELNDIQLRIIVQGTGLDNLTRLNSTLSNTMSGLNNAAGAATNANGAWSRFRDSLSDLERRFDAVFRAASHLQALGNDLTGMGQAGFGMLKGAVDQWGEYEFAIHRAAGALSIFDVQSPIFDQLQDAVNEAAQEVRLFPAEEIARAVYYWGSATGQTVSTQEELAVVMDGLIPIMQTAAITETDYEKAIKGTYQIIQQYGLGVTRMATAQDVARGAASRVGEEISNTRDITEKLMMVTQNTAVEYTDLIEAFKYTGSIAPALGVTYEEILVTLGRLGDLGLRGGTAGRALQQTFSKLVDPTVRAHSALNKAWESAYGLGKTFNEMVFPNGEFIGLAQYIDQLADVTEEMTQQERNQLIAIMTTQNELRTMVPLVEDQIRARREGINVYDDEKYALQNASEQFQRTMHLLEISWKGTMGYLAATIGPIVRLIGSEVARLATPFIEQFGKILQQVKLWLDTHPEVVKWIVRFTAFASAAALIAGAIFTALGVLIAFGAGISFVISGFARFFGIFTKFLPIVGLLVGAVSAFIAVWVNNFGGIRDAIGKVIDAVGNLFSKLEISGGGGFGALSDLGERVMPILLAVAEKVAWFLERVADGINMIADNPDAVAVVQRLAEGLAILFALNTVMKVTDMAISMLTLGRHSRVASRAVGALKAQVIGLNNASKARGVKGMFDYITKSIGLAAVAVKKKMATIVATVRGASIAVSTSIKGVLIATGIGLIIVAIALLYEAWTNNWGDIQGKTRVVIEWVGDKIGWLGDRFNEFAAWIGDVVDTIISHWNNFTSTIGKIWNDIVTTATGIWDDVSTSVKTAWENITTTIRDAIDNVVTFFSELPGRIGEWLTSVWDTVTTAINNVVTTIVEFPGKVWDSLMGALADLLNNINLWWESLGPNTEDRLGFIIGYVAVWGANMVGKFVEWLSTLPGLFWNWLTSVADTIATWATNTWNTFTTWMGDVWNSLTTWISQTWTAFTQWATDVFNTVTEWFSKLPGRIWDFLTTMWNNFTKWIADTWNAFTTWVTNVYNTVTDWLSKLPGRIWSFLSEMWTNFSTWFSNLIRDVGTWASNTLNAIIDWIKKLPGRVMEWANNTSRDFGRWFESLKVNGGIWARNAINAIVDWFIKLPGKVMDEVSRIAGLIRTFLKELPGKLWNALVGVGTDIIDGIKQGIEDAWNGFINWWTGLFAGMERGAAEANESSSPSKVYMRLGKDIMDGLRIGIERNNGAVKAMNSQVDQIITTAQRLGAETAGVTADYGATFEVERRVIIEHRVSSPDGTVNAASRETIKEIFTAEDMVSSLEHMVMVG